MRYFFIIAFLSLFSVTSLAGQASQAEQQSQFSSEQVIAFAKQVEYQAAEQGARAFIIARVGQSAESLPDGIAFTHTAVAIYSQLTLADGEVVNGYQIYNLYQKATNPAKSHLVNDFPVDFFWGAAELKAGILIPIPALQQRLIELVASGQHQSLHNENYSIIANPFNDKYQNCTEFTLDMINASIYQTLNVKQLKVNAKKYFKPQRVKVSRFKLAMGNLFVDHISTDDHSKRQIYTTSFGSIKRYLDDNDLLSQSLIING
ncbi:DUF2145 domain-containing protein [Catenovulum sp. SM1970]|uniref:DUF2145 domain-containing protein n=1 Tax=Marinifaba aquimaris TaxID=2741323 RepID=UPI001573E282|nr:DUF2145 domain-containing protein [Marinifaba aquimaris]NTS75746.1 DUF2145 domain-containing protein [Marinifaba aquimaris]